MNILITGGAGYIGTELTAQLAAMEAVKRIIVYDNLSRENFNLFLGDKFIGNEKVKFIKGELLDSRTLRKALKEVDVVYHLAAKVTTPFANVDAHLYEQVNHWGTAELAYALEESDVKSIVFTSSAGVYGSASEAMDEKAAPNPQTYYAISKLRAEDHIRRLQSKMNTYIFRCGNVYGYNRSMRFDAVINKFVFDASFEKRITIHGDGSQSRSFIHINSIGKALAKVVESDLAGGTYNLVERSIKVMDIVDELKQQLPDIEFILINQHMKLSNLLIKENSFLNKKLGIEIHRSFKDELKEFLGEFSF
jgi:UDP-glucose 4-epimerase